MARIDLMRLAGQQVRRLGVVAHGYCGCARIHRRGGFPNHLNIGIRVRWCLTDSSAEIRGRLFANVRERYTYAGSFAAELAWKVADHGRHSSSLESSYASVHRG